MRVRHIAVMALLLIGAAVEVHAGWTGPGCWRCKYTDLTSSNARCEMVGHGEEGEGTNCYQGDLMGSFCEPNGVLCYNTQVGGGGGGTGGGGGGGGCTVGPSASCPAQCMSCQRTTF